MPIPVKLAKLAPVVTTHTDGSQTYSLKPYTFFIMLLAVIAGKMTLGALLLLWVVESSFTFGPDPLYRNKNATTEP